MSEYKGTGQQGALTVQRDYVLGRPSSLFSDMINRPKGAWLWSWRRSVLKGSLLLYPKTVGF